MEAYYHFVILDAKEKGLQDGKKNQYYKGNAASKRF